MTKAIKKDFYYDSQFKQNVCLVYIEGENRSAATLAALFNEACKDFPGLDTDKVYLMKRGSKPVSSHIESKALIFSGSSLHCAGVDANCIRFTTKTKPPSSYRNLGGPIAAQG